MKRSSAGVAQLVEHHIGNVKVAGSIPVPSLYLRKTGKFPTGVPKRVRLRRGPLPW